MGKYKGAIKDALLANMLTLVVLSILYVFAGSLFSFFSTGKDSSWLLSKYVTFKNNGRAPVYEDNVLICSIEGVSSRDSIAAIIGRLNSYGPSAIGCDIIFSQASGVDSMQNIRLKQAVEGNGKIIVAQRPVLDGLGRLSHVEESIFEDCLSGDVTVYSDGSHSRDTFIDGVKFENFASLVAETACGEVRYPKRQYSVDYTYRYFPVMGIDDIVESDVKGKIVLLGDTEDLRDYIDMDFAMTDHRYSNTMTTSKRVPGVFLHAYAVASMVNDNWIIAVPNWISLILGFIASFFLTLLGKCWTLKGIPRCYFKCVHLAVFTFMIWVCYPLYLWFDVIMSPLYFTIGVAMSDFSLAGLDMARHIKSKLPIRRKHV